MCIKVGGSCETVAVVSGRKQGERHRSANFVAVLSAADTRTATVLAQVRQEHGSDLLLCENCDSLLSMP